MDKAAIMIVEDEAVVALDLKMQLEELGYRVVGMADTAAAAVAMAERERPDLTLMDVMLKGEADGIAAADALRRTLGTPVVFLTSFSDADTVRRAARTGAYGYLTKPFQIKELRAGIEVALSKARMERQLRESERWFASTLRCVQDGVVVVDAQARVRFINPVAEALTGWPLDDAAGQAVTQIVRFDDHDDRFAEAGANAVLQAVPQAVPQAVLQALQQARVIGVRHARGLLNRDGEVRRVDESAGPVRDEHGVLLGAVLVLRDATLRLQQEGLLRASEERFRTAFEFAPLGMALVALDGGFIQVNDALCRLLRRDAAWLCGQTQAQVTHPDDVPHEEHRLHALLAGGAPVVQFEKRYLRGGGGAVGLEGDPPAVSVLVSVSVLREADEPTCYLYQVHDLSAQHEAAAQLALLAGERLKREAVEVAHQSKNEFLSRVSHEMRTPLNAVLGFAQLLKLQDPGGQTKAATYSEHILNAGRHLLALVDDVLDLQRSADGSLRLTLAPVALADAVAEAVQLLAPLAAAQGIVVDSAVPPELKVNADPVRLRQVLLNLGSNAVKYNLPRGRVVVAAVAAAPDRVRLTIRDSGVGMNDQQLGQLFQPFNRLGREASAIPGVGLGLVITQKLIEHMGGLLAISSEADVGTEVVVTLPQAS